MRVEFQHMIEHYNLSGFFIDCTAMEASGGGYYPAFLAENGKVIGKVSNDIGQMAYDLINRHTEAIDMESLAEQNIFCFGYVDGPQIDQLGTDNIYHEPYIDAMDAEEILSKFKPII